MWQRDPGGGGTGGGPVGQGGKTVLQKEREKKEKARMKATLRRRVAIVLEQLQQEEGTIAFIYRLTTVLEQRCMRREVE